MIYEYELLIIIAINSVYTNIILQIYSANLETE